MDNITEEKNNASDNEEPVDDQQNEIIAVNSGKPVDDEETEIIAVNSGKPPIPPFVLPPLTAIATKSDNAEKINEILDKHGVILDKYDVILDKFGVILDKYARTNVATAKRNVDPMDVESDENQDHESVDEDENLSDANKHDESVDDGNSNVGKFGNIKKNQKKKPRPSDKRYVYT